MGVLGINNINILYFFNFLIDSRRYEGQWAYGK